MTEKSEFCGTADDQPKVIKTLPSLRVQSLCKMNRKHKVFPKYKEENRDSAISPFTNDLTVDILHEPSFTSSTMNSTVQRKNSVHDEMKMCLSKIHVEKFPPVWKENILQLLPKKYKNKHFVLIQSILNEVKNMYIQDMQIFILKITLTSSVNNRDCTALNSYKKHRFENEKSITCYNTFVKNRNLLANKYFLFLRPVKTIINVAQLKLPNVICNFKCYYDCGLLTLNVFQSMIANDIRKGSLAITNQFYIEASRAISGTKILKNITISQLSNIMRCITNIFVQQILNIMINSINHIINIMGHGHYCPQIKFQLSLQDNEFIVNPSIEQVFSMYHSIIDNIENIAPDLIPFEEWLSVRTTSKYIKTKLPAWYIEESHRKLQCILNRLFQPIRDHLVDIRENFYPVCVPNTKKRSSSLPSGRINFDLYLKHVQRYNIYLIKANAMVENIYYTVGKLEQSQAKEALKKQSSDITNIFLVELIKHHKEFNQSICLEFESIERKALNIPKDAKSLIKLTEHVSYVSKTLVRELEQKIQESIRMLSVLLEITILTDDHIALNKKTINWLHEVEPIFIQNNTLTEAMKSELEDDMQRRINLLNSKVDSIVPQLSVLDDMDDIQRIREYVEYYKNFLKHVNEIDHEMQIINEEETLFRFPETEFPKVLELKDIIMPFYTLIYVIYQWQRDNDTWLDGPFEWLDATTIEMKTLNYFERITEMSKVFKSQIKMDVTANKCFKFSGIADDPEPMQQPAPLKLSWQALNNINDFKQYLPLVTCMCNPALLKRHWIEMSAICNFDLTPNAGTSLRKIIAYDLMEDIEKYEAISISANKELALQQKLFQMIKEWNEISFEMTINIESDMIDFLYLDDIELLLGEHLSKIEEMKVSNFVKPIIPAVTDFFTSLVRIQEVITQWHLIQELKLSLNSIFSYCTIERYLPKEAALYIELRQALLNIQQNLAVAPNFKQINDPLLLNTLYSTYKKLESVRRGVKDYMETKRLHFPRFFFLSDKEMQKVLYESNITEKYIALNKCFEGILKIRVREDNSIYSVLSDSGEQLQLCKPAPLLINCKTEESWLINLENELNNTVQKTILKYYAEYEKGSICDDILCFPSMVIICIFLIHWTSEVHATFVQFDSASLNSLYLKYTKHLSVLINEIKNCSTRRHRDVLMSLTIIVSNQKDVIKLLLDRNVTKSIDFEWVAQLRYYLDDNQVNVSLFNTTIKYGYEYGYYKQCIINTPLTDRCFHVLLQAHRYHLYGAIVGAPGTGKSETIKSLAKALAVQFHVFNCTNISSYCILSEIFKGLVSCGAWICLENFHKLEMQVLSAITENITCISHAIAINLKSVTLDGTSLNLNPAGYISITMSLNQSGYSNLPDNLKTLFRTVSMSVPDIKRITEVELFAGGFTNSKCLSLRLAAFYKVLSEQLQCKQCKEFSMYSLKTIIKTAILFKQSFPDEDEAMLLLRSVINTNLSKLCDIDVLTFNCIVHDMFPSVILYPPNYTVLLKTLETACKTKSLDLHDVFKLKTIQMFELMYIHQNLILVGDPFGGKTEILQILVDVLFSLHKQGLDMGANIRVEIISPGVINNSQLFGYFDSKSGIWKDGIYSKAVRSFPNNSFTKKWIVFDGSLSDLWVENLYTVLDTTKMLYLASGEKIRIADSVSVIFETMNMLEISPAILSRCGILYIDSQSIDWRPYIKSHISKNNIYNGYEEVLYSLFEWVLDPCLQFVQKDCVQTATVGKLHIVMSVLNIFEMYLEDACTESTEEKGKINHFIIWAQVALLLSITWGFGGTLNMDSLIKFNNFCVSLWSGRNEQFPKPEKIKHFDITVPTEGLIQDNFYIFKGIGNWKYWGDLLKLEKILEMPTCKKMFIPTINSLKYNHILLKHIKYQKPFLLCGDLSTGKTSFMQYLLNDKLPKENYLPNFFSFNSLNTIKKTQLLLLSKLNKTRKRHYGSPTKQFYVNFIDDFSTRSTENKSDINGILELLRQYLSYGYMYDINEPEKVFIANAMFILTIIMDREINICPRFLRHFNIFTMYIPTSDSIFRIFSNILFTNLKKNLFAADVLSSVTSITNATIDIYNSVVKILRPIPSKFHYCFNIGDVNRVITGCSLLQKESVETKITFLRLWVHEIWRVFSDRILDNNDKEWLFLRIRESVKAHFKDTFETAFDYLPKFENQIKKESFNDLMFGNLIDSEKSKTRKYEEINSIETLRNKVLSYINDYNSNFKHNIDMVVSNYVLECLIKISRILVTPGSNLLMISSTGIGRKSITKLAAYIQQQKLFEPSVQSYSDFAMWRADLKKVLCDCSESKRDVTLFLTDKQLTDVFLRDICSLLSTGEIPDLFSLEDKRNIIELVRLDAQSGDKNAEMSISSVMKYFIEQCLNKLHIVLCFSVTNTAIRSHLHTYSALIKHCTINCYEVWPEDTLIQIGTKYIQHVNIQESMKANITNACIKFYNNIREMSKIYCQETGRMTYITLSAFLHKLKLYTRFISKKQEDIVTTRNRYLAGLEKLKLAAQQVEQMKATLTILKPQLESSAQQTIITMKKVETENITVERATTVVKQEEEIANKKAEIAGALRTECEADLAVAIPILEDAVAALNTLKPTDITLVKAMKNPPDTVKLVMAAVCVMLNVSPDKTIDSVTGKKYIDYWGPSKRVLGDMNFLQNLKEYDKDNIPSSVMQIIKKTYMTDVSFRPHIVAKASSAAEGLCKWVRAMVSYDDVAKVVAPKKEKLFAAQKECDEAETFLNEKRKTLSALNAKLAALNKNLQETLQEKLKLEKEVESCTSKLKKAENLIASLGGEKDRWMQCAKNLQVNYDNLVGDMILSCGIIAYMAPYGFAFRNKILEDWKQYINDLKIPYTKNYTFVNMFGEENDITYWYFCGLPKNCFSTENAIIMKNSNLWCLFIDSQNQANQWIKQIEKKNGLKVVKLTDPNYMPIIQYNVENGIPILIENVKEQLDIQLDPFLMQTIYKDDNTCYLDTGRDSIRYSDDFRLYITTRLLNPQYSYETFSKLTIIDFSIPNEALQDKLLDIIISREKPEHQERFEVLLRQDAANKKILKQQEDNILSTLSSAATNILEDESAIQILDSSKNLSLNVMKKQEAAKSMALEINKFRDTYIQFVKHCASLFSTLNALSYLNHMYCFSFSWFIQLYIRSIETSNRSIVLEKRLGFLKSSFIENLHSSVCRSLSEKHTILYSFLLCSNIMLDNQEATEEELKVFMSLNLCHVDSVSNCAPNWLPYDVWNGIYTINSKFLAFHGLVDDFLHNTDLWKQYYNSEPLQSHLMPKPWINKLSSFQKLILLKILRPDKVIIEIIKLIESTMGNLQNYSPRYKISQSFVESSCLTPLVFILPSCSPPLSLISTFASAKGYSSKFTCLSMGYGQESKAEFLIQEAQKEGGWVFLQNCHLATHWMVQLEKICENCQDSNVSLDFRLWLSSYPTDEFPISILQNSIKITNDYPLNFKQNLLNIYQSEPIANKEFFDGCPGKDKIFSKLLFGLCLFHIATKERSHFGIQSWNIPYDFDHSDFQLSITQLQDTINNTSYVPFDILLYTIGECHYGGKIIDHYDLRCLRYLLEHYFNKDIIKDERYTASNTIRQLIPQRCEYLHVIKHIMEMPLNVPPQVYGCNENGVITRDSTIAAQFLSSVSDMNSVTQSPNENCIQDQVLALINDIYKKLPKLLEIDELKDRVSVPVEPLDRVLLYESRLFNHALNIIIDTLNNLKLAFDGYITLSDSLKKSSKRIYNNQVPHNWKELQNGIVINNLSYYIDNLSNREDFLKNWIIKKSSNIIRLDALFSSKMFLSSVLLTFSKQHVIPVEQVVYDFKVSTIKESSEVNDTEIYFIHGLYLAGAQWNCEKNILKESFANVFWQEMPPIRFKCVQNNEYADESYECPLYITAIRHKNNNIVTNMNNYITRVPLKTDVHYSHWIKCGTALFSHVPR